jgi:hypothetical protein
MGAEPFRVEGCALPAIAIGKHAQNLRELREYLTVMAAITHRLQYVEMTSGMAESRLIVFLPEKEQQLTIR